MTDYHQFSVSLLRLLTDVIKKLKDDQIEQLVAGKADLAFVPPGASIVFPGPDAHEVRGRLSATRNREDAEEYLTGLKLKKPDLVSLAKQLDVAVVSKDNMAIILRKIIDATVGMREDAAAIRDRSWSR